MGSRNLWTRLSFALLFTIVMQTMARPNTWFAEIFDKPQDSKKGETNIEMKRPNSRMIDKREVSNSSRFWDDLAPVFPRHLVQAFSGALRLCDILRWEVLVHLVHIDISQWQYSWFTLTLHNANTRHVFDTFLCRFAEETFASLLFPFSPVASRVDQSQVFKSFKIYW